MRHYTIQMLAFILLLLPGSAEATTLNTNKAPIDEVTVYHDRAQVNRSARVSVPPGRTLITLTGLPAPLLPGSVRAKVDREGVQVVGLTQREAVHVEQRREETRKLEARHRIITTSLRKLRLRDGEQQAKLKQISQLRQYTRQTVALQQTDPGVDVNTLTKTLDFFRTESDKSIRERSTVQMEINSLLKEYSAIQQRLNDLKAGKGRTTTSVTVTLESKAQSSTNLVVSYGVGGVSWSPRYDIHYDKDALQFTYLAQVQQASGEDWNEVDLIFTTARPDKMDPPPNSESLHLSGYKEKETTVRLTDITEEKSLSNGAIASADKPTSTVAIVRRSLAVDLKVNHPSTVPADGRPYRISVLEKTLKAEVDRYAAPKLSPQLFLRARTSNETGVLLLAGPADIFRSSGYVGTITLKELAAGEPIHLSLGPAGPLTVSRVFDMERNRTVEKTGSRKKVHFVYDIEVHNFGEKTYEVTVSDHVPVSRVAKVKVDVSEKTTAGFTTDKDESIYSWKLALKPGEKKRVHLAYIVDLPKDYSWQGF